MKKNIFDEINLLMSDKFKKELTIKPLILKTLDIPDSHVEFSRGYYELIHSNLVINMIIKKFCNIFSDLEVSDKIISKNDIKKGNLITFYPIHNLYIREDTNKKILFSPELSIYLEKNNEEMTIDLLKKYSITSFESDFVICGYKNIKNDYQLGHLIKRSKNNNCYLKLINSTIWVVIASKDIKKGEEILLSSDYFYD